MVLMSSGVLCRSIARLIEMHFHQGDEFGRQSTFLKMHRRDTRRRWEPPSPDATPKDVLDGPLLPLPLSPKSLYLRPFKSNWIAQGRRDIEEGTREGAAFPSLV